MDSFKRDGYTVELGDALIHVDNEARFRSGHMSHAMVEYKPDHVIDFNSNCSAALYGGHSTYGWVEYRYSSDAGASFSEEIHALPYSKQSLYDGIHTISVEKAVVCDDGTLVAICLRNDAHKLCEPWDTPTVVRSLDGGKTWTEPSELCPYKGRVYDARYHNGVVYALEFCNDGVKAFCGWNDEHVYRIFASYDSGVSFEEVCVVPIPSKGRGYGSMIFDGEGRLHVYAYNLNAEREMDHIVSEDCGKTWGSAEVCYVAKGIRNPQTAIVDGIFVLHARAEQWTGFVLYTSRDGSHWDEGEYIGTNTGGCYYSNNVLLNDPNGGKRLLIQYSECYHRDCVNVMHRWLKIRK